VPEVRGLPAVTGGGPVRGSAERRGARLLSLAGGVGVVALVALGIVGSLVEDDEPSTGAEARSATSRAVPLSAAQAYRAIGLLRSGMRPGDRVLSVSISESYASARVLPAGGAGARSLSVGSDGRVTSSPSSSTSESSRGVPLDDLDLRAPGRVVEAVRRGLGPGPTGTLRSLTAYSFRDEPLRWSASVEGGPEVARSWSADAQGYAVVRVRDGAPAPRAGEPGPATVPAGVTGRSLLVSENLRSALGALGALPGLRDRSPDEIRLSSLAVEPERAAVGIQEGATRRLVTVDAAFGVDPSSVSRSSDGSTVALSSVDAAGPARALRTIGRRLSTDAASQVRSVSLALAGVGDAPGSEPPGWLVLLGGEGADRVWRASLDGRRVGRSGEDLTP
jgi:hypothetical protein